MPIAAPPRLLLLLFVLLALSYPRQTSAAPLVVLRGIVPADVRSGLARALGPLPATRSLSLRFALASRDPSGLAQALRATYERTSPNYHHYLTPAQFAARFGPDPTAEAALATWLRAHGLRPRPWHGETVLQVDATAAVASRAFGVTLGRYRLALAGYSRAAAPTSGVRSTSDGELSIPSASSGTPASETFMAPDRDPLLPASLASSVLGLFGLSSDPLSVPAAQTSARAPRRSTDGPGGGLEPSRIAAAYNYQPIYAAGYHGEHMRVALVELASYAPSDIAAYAQQYQLSPTIVTHDIDGGNAGAPASVEAAQDIELLASAVPGAAIDVYNAPNGDLASLVDAYSAVASAGNAQVLSLQWLLCEQESARHPGLVETEYALFQQLALQGTTVVSASGDAGVYACSGETVAAGQKDPYASLLAVNLPASSPYVLAVGATSLNIRNADGSIGRTESAWSCRRTRPGGCPPGGSIGDGSGGGISQLFRTGDSLGSNMSWQSGPGVGVSLSNGARLVPDVSISGSYSDGIDREYSIFWNGSWRVSGGTSAAAPMWAALIVLTDQYLLLHGQQAAGWINPLVYQLGATPQPYPPYHDITAGDNLLYPAAPGWDFASGWGSPDAWNFLRDIAVAPPVGSTPQPTASATALRTPLPSATPSPRAPKPTATVVAIFTPVPTCPASGIGNGDFESGTLRCWYGSGGILPRVIAGVPLAGIGARGRYSVQLGASRAGKPAASLLSQTFQVPSTLAHPVLRLEFWLSHSGSPVPQNCSTGTVSTRCASALAARPLLLLTDAQAKVLVRQPFLPHRERAWSGLAVPLPARSGRLTLTLELPAQPAGVSALLALDNVRVGS